VQRARTLDETVKRLGTAIRLGVLSPGSRLPPERDLANRLRVNRSTLHEALSTLVQDGYLVARRGRGGGTFVAEAPPPSTGRAADRPGDDVWDVLDQRVVIEMGATILASERALPADLSLLEQAVERMDRATTFDDYRHADVRFHIGVAQATDSPRLVATMTEVHGDMCDVIAPIPHPVERLIRANDQHRSLVRLLRQGDVAHASLLMREHIGATEQILTQNVVGPSSPPCRRDTSQTGSTRSPRPL
jgi:GntR family transcriptional regulator, transcriptional repressor for pyruvate dehydrogenase complex